MSNTTQQQNSHHKDNATKFMERSLNSIAFRQRFEKWLMIFLIIVCILMIIATIWLYSIGK